MIHLACQHTQSGTPVYSWQATADRTSVSQNRVSAILRSGQFTSHRTEYWCEKNPDPHFEDTMVEIVVQYWNPPKNALVLSVDEKTQIQDPASGPCWF